MKNQGKITSTAIQKLCWVCGQMGHVAGKECPQCCSICGGTLDDDNNCFEYRCSETAEKCPTDCDHATNQQCAFRSNIELSQVG